jgi:hypothetical protein
VPEADNPSVVRILGGRKHDVFKAVMTLAHTPLPFMRSVTARGKYFLGPLFFGNEKQQSTR